MPLLVKGKNIVPRDSSGGNTPRGPKGSTMVSDDPDEFRAPLSDHLEELRVRLFRSLFILVGGWVVGWVIIRPLYDALQKHVIPNIAKGGPDGLKIDIRFQNATDPFLLLLKLSFTVGIFIALPFIVYQLWGFIAPGLKEREKKPIRAILPVAIVLFFLGAYFCWLILPAAYGWFASFFDYFPGTALFQDPNQMISFCVKMMLAFGICFQLPLVVYAMGSIGFLSAETLMKYWRQATVAIFFIAAAITPSNDPISMLMMAIPLCILFAISVYAVKLTQRKKAEEHDEDLDDLD